MTVNGAQKSRRARRFEKFQFNCLRRPDTMSDGTQDTAAALAAAEEKLKNKYGGMPKRNPLTGGPHKGQPKVRFLHPTSFFQPAKIII